MYANISAYNVCQHRQYGMTIQLTTCQKSTRIRLHQHVSILAVLAYQHTNDAYQHINIPTYQLYQNINISTYQHIEIQRSTVILE